MQPNQKAFLTYYNDIISMESSEDRLQLITRNTEEILGEEDLISQLQS